MKKLIVTGTGIIKCIIIILCLFQLRFTGFLSNFTIFSTSYDNLQLVFLYYTLIGICLLLFVIENRGTIKKDYLFSIFMLIFGVSVSGYYRGRANNGLLLEEAMTVILKYSYVLLALPISKLLIMKKWKFRSFLQQIVNITMIAYIVRIIISIVYGLTGTIILETIARYGSMENWIRNGILRINPPCFGLIFLPIAYYLFVSEKSKQKRMWYLVCIITCFCYSIFLHGRSVMIYQFICMVVMYMYNKNIKRITAIRVICVLIGTVVLVNTPYVDTLLDSFSTSNSEMGGSTTWRLLSLEYFGNLYLESPLWGTGFLPSAQRYSPTGGTLVDIGFLYSIFMLGFPMIVLYGYIFCRGIKVFFDAKKADNDRFILILGMTVLIILTCINIDCFGMIYSFAMPFYMAIVEYVAYECKESSALSV